MKKEQIKKLKKEGINPIQISKELNIPLSTVRYYYNDETRLRHINHVKLMRKENPIKRNKLSRRKYQREYQRKRYREDEIFREKIKEYNRINQKKKYNGGKQ